MPRERSRRQHEAHFLGGKVFSNARAAEFDV
jgi:hypothetical protein